MSSANENRWRASPSSRQNPTARPNDRDRSSTSNQIQQQSQSQQQQQQQSQQQPSNAKNQGQQPSPALPVQNVWADRSRSRSGSARGPVQGPGPGNRAGAPVAGPVVNGGAAPEIGVAPTATEERRVKMLPFNGQEVSAYMRRAFQEATSGDTTKKSLYQPPKDPRAGAWGNNKPILPAAAMSNGQDFFYILSRQITALEQGQGQGRGG